MSALAKDSSYGEEKCPSDLLGSLQGLSLPQKCLLNLLENVSFLLEERLIPVEVFLRPCYC